MQDALLNIFKDTMMHLFHERSKKKKHLIEIMSSLSNQLNGFLLNNSTFLKVVYVGSLLSFGSEPTIHYCLTTSHKINQTVRPRLLKVTLKKLPHVAEMLMIKNW